MIINELERIKAGMIENVAAIEQLVGHLRATSFSVPPVQAPRLKYSQKAEIVERIIKRQRTTFDIYGICLEFEKETGIPPTRRISLIVSQVINKLRQRNPQEIVVDTPGKGSRSGVYKLPS